MRSVAVWDGTELQRLVDVSSVPALAQHVRGSRDILSERALGETTDVINSRATEDITRTSAPCDSQGVLDRLADVYEEVQTLSERIALRHIVEQLRWAGHCALIVNKQVRHEGAQPVLLGNHVSVEGSHEARCTTRHVVDLIETVVQVTSFEVMWDTRNLSSCAIPEIRIDVAEVLNSFAKHGVSTIVENDHSELVNWPIDLASSPGSIHNNIHLFLTAGNEAVDRWHIVALKTKLSALSPLQDEHVPQRLDEEWHSHRDFCADEDPGHRKAFAIFLLRIDDEENTENEVHPVRDEREDAEEWSKQEQPAFPSRHVIPIVARIESDDMTRLILLGCWRLMARYQRLEGFCGGLFLVSV